MNLQSLIDFFKGKKTYFIGFLMIVLGLLNNDTAMIFEGLGLMTLRAGVAKI